LGRSILSYLTELGPLKIINRQSQNSSYGTRKGGAPAPALASRRFHRLKENSLQHGAAGFQKFIF
ncbi:hypothetical protein, partial [Paenibacillus qinlingensis]|uniref:hypothetical protein n=1 Tax=Paenibacillus qinlingensis TaxID=1837343 RepID=UPI00286E3578